VRPRALIGSTRGQILRMMGVEGVVIALAGTPGIYLTVIGAAIAPTLTVTLLSSWSALRPRPVEAATSD
jgi:putative ABC transport system permease protein